MQEYAEQSSALGSVAGLIRQTLDESGQDSTALFDACRIDPDVASDPHARVPTARLHALWNRCIEATGDPAFGLTVAQRFQPSVLHGLGFAWLASDTLRDAFRRLTRYSRFINPSLGFAVHDDVSTVDLVVTMQRNWPEWSDAAIDCGMAILVRMCRMTLPPHGSPIRTVLQRTAPSRLDPFRAVFGPAIQFGAPDNRLCFDREQVDRQLISSNPELARANDKTVIDYLARFDRDNLTMRVRARIIEELPGGTPSQSSIAKALHVSSRSLQRRLQREDTTFKSVLDETRHELAVHYLREPHRSVGEITFLLGFSEPGNFTRAFRRWTGTSPAQFRRRA